jgi:Uma2 family endonuclease
MSVVTSTQAEQQFTLYDLSWDQYETLLRALGDRRLRHTYVEGVLEIVSPSMDHESSKSVLGDFVVTLCRVLRQPRKSIGSTTMKKMKWRRGLEPDEGFYVGQESVPRMRSRREYDPERDPPPDLIVEVDITSSSDDRMEFYRRLRVSEVWRYANEMVHVYGLMQNGRYRKLRRSRLFPLLTGDDLTRFLALRDSMDDTELELEFEKWVRSQMERVREAD